MYREDTTSACTTAGSNSSAEESGSDAESSLLSTKTWMASRTMSSRGPMQCRVDENRMQALRTRDRARRQDVIFYREMNYARTWIEGEREIELEIQGLMRQTRNGRFCVDTYGITFRHVDIRTTWVRLEHGQQIIDIMHIIRELWIDMVNLDDNIKVIYVNPQPPPVRTRDCLHVLVDLRPELRGQVVLHAIKFAYHEHDQGIFQLLAARHLGPQSAQRLALDMGTFTWYATRTCTYWLHRRGHYMGEHERNEMIEGELVRHEIWFNQEAREVLSGHQHQQQDESTMMQTDLARRRQRQLFVYRVNREEPDVYRRRLDGPLSDEDFIRESFVVYNPQDPRTIEVFKVNPQPENMQFIGATGYLLSLAEEWRFGGKSLILLDVEFYTNDPAANPLRPTPNEEWREVTWCDKTTTRARLIRDIGLSQFCMGPTQRCILHVAGFYWSSTDLTTREVPNGSFVVIKILQEVTRIPLDQQWRMIQDGCTMDQIREQSDRQEAQSSNPTGSRRSNHTGTGTTGETDDTEDTVMFQRYTRSFAAVARDRIPPPGNGRVTFNEMIEIDGNTQRDRAVGNTYMEEFCSDLRDIQGQNHHIGLFLQDIRHGEEPDVIEESNDNLESVVIQLQNLLPIQEDGSCETCDMEIEDVIQKIREDHRSKFSLKNNWHDIKGLHSKVRERVETQTVHAGTTIERIHIYTDGSCINTHQGTCTAAWAFVIELEYRWNDMPSYVLAGYDTGRLQLSVLSDMHVGEEKLDSMEAEAVALFWALAWILSWEADQLPEIVIHGDNMPTLFASAAEWRIPVRKGKPVEIAKKARFLAQFLESQGSRVRYEHVKAHKGSVGNEAADSIAHACAKGLLQEQAIWTSRTTWIKRLANHPDLPRLWQVHAKGIVAMTDHKGLLEKPRETSQEIVDIIRNDYVQVIEDKEDCDVRLKVATINVFASLDKGSSTWTSKRECLAEQFHQKGWHIIALQETRYRPSILKSNEKYWMVTSGATARGFDGIELWIDKQIKIGGMTIKLGHFFVLERTPNLLSVAIRHPQLKVDVFVGHAPQRDDPEAGKWWMELSSKIGERAKNGKPIWLLGDMNSRVGSEYCTGIGTKDPELECNNGKMMRELIERYGLVAVNTLRDVHAGHSQTYHNSRLDYFAVSDFWQQCVAQTWTDEEVDLMHRKDDHKPLIGVICYSTAKTRQNTLQKAKYDQKAANSREARPIIQKKFKKYETPDWATSVDEHVQHLTSYLLVSLARHFPMAERQPKKQFLEGQTWKLIQDRKTLQHEIQKGRQLQRRHLVSVAFEAWRGRRTKSRDTLLWQTQAVMEEALVRTSERVKHCLRQDKEAFLRQQLDKLENSLKDEDAKQIFQALRTFRPQTPRKRIKTPRPLPMLQGDHGQVTDHQEWVEAWLQHWARIECASIQRYDQHIENNIDKEQTTWCNIEEITEAWPTLLDIEQVIQKTKSGKVPGQDGITADIYKQSNGSTSGISCDR